MMESSDDHSSFSHIDADNIHSLFAELADTSRAPYASYRSPRAIALSPPPFTHFDYADPDLPNPDEFFQPPSDDEIEEEEEEEEEGGEEQTPVATGNRQDYWNRTSADSHSAIDRSDVPLLTLTRTDDDTETNSEQEEEEGEEVDSDADVEQAKHLLGGSLDGDERKNKIARTRAIETSTAMHLDLSTVPGDVSSTPQVKVGSAADENVSLLSPTKARTGIKGKGKGKAKESTSRQTVRGVDLNLTINTSVKVAPGPASSSTGLRSSQDTLVSQPSSSTLSSLKKAFQGLGGPSNTGPASAEPAKGAKTKRKGKKQGILQNYPRSPSLVPQSNITGPIPSFDEPLFGPQSIATSAQQWIKESGANRSTTESMGDVIENYRNFLCDRAYVSPHLSTIAEMLYRDSDSFTSSRVNVLEINEQGGIEAVPFLPGEGLRLKDYLAGGMRGRGRIILMEGLSQESVAAVGSQVDVDPDFFYDHYEYGNSLSDILSRVPRPQEILSCPRFPIVRARLPHEYGVFLTPPTFRPTLSRMEVALNSFWLKVGDQSAGSGEGWTAILIIDPLAITPSMRLQLPPKENTRPEDAFSLFSIHITSADAHVIQSFHMDQLQVYLLTMRVSISWWTDLHRELLVSIINHSPTFTETYDLDTMRSSDAIIQTCKSHILGICNVLKRYGKRGQIFLGPNGRSCKLGKGSKGLIDLLEVDFETMMADYDELALQFDFRHRHIKEYHAAQASIKTLAHADAGLSHAIAGLQQANSLRRLTQLAFIYVPVTFVATVLSMNITDFVDFTIPKLHWFFVFSVIFVIVTLSGVWYLANGWIPTKMFFWNKRYQIHRAKLDYITKVDWRRSQMFRLQGGWYDRDRFGRGWRSWKIVRWWRLNVAPWFAFGQHVLPELEGVPINPLEQEFGHGLATLAGPGEWV